jgi:hypothetical protein
MTSVTPSTVTCLRRVLAKRVVIPKVMSIHPYTLSYIPPDTLV